MDDNREVRQRPPTLSTGRWCALLLAVFIAALIACCWPRSGRPGGMAVVRVDGATVQTIALNAPGARECAVGGCVIRAEGGRVRVAEADCPDQICVRQGWIGGGDVPVVCLPNRLVITVEDGEEPQFDAVSQ